VDVEDPGDSSAETSVEAEEVVGGHALRTARARLEIREVRTVPVADRHVTATVDADPNVPVAETPSPSLETPAPRLKILLLRQLRLK